MLCNVIFRRVGLPYDEGVSAMQCNVPAVGLPYSERVSAMQRNVFGGLYVLPSG